tara:strand:- start:534 stop:896 length:363 start_codon:yes stop_codon:yes gene_type:complete
MNVDGTQLTEITPQDKLGEYSRPRWSPNGTKIVFYKSGDGTDCNSFIGIVNSDGSNEQQLTCWPGYNEDYPDFSPDGTQVVFRSSAGAPYDDTYRVSVIPGSTPIRVTDSDLFENQEADW